MAGLTTALVLARKGYKVTVVAQHLPGDLSIEYTSPWAVCSCYSSAKIRVQIGFLQLFRSMSIEIDADYSVNARKNTTELVIRSSWILPLITPRPG